MRSRGQKIISYDNMHIGNTPCCGCSVHVAMILAHPISQHEAVSTIFISVLIGFRVIRASESRIHIITCCTHDVLYGGNTILVCRLVNQMHIRGLYLTYYIVNITSLSFHFHCHITGFEMCFFFTKWDDYLSVWKIVISFINPKRLVMHIRLGPFCAH